MYHDALGPFLPSTLTSLGALEISFRINKMVPMKPLRISILFRKIFRISYEVSKVEESDPLKIPK